MSSILAPSPHYSTFFSTSPPFDSPRPRVHFPRFLIAHPLFFYAPTPPFFISLFSPTKFVFLLFFSRREVVKRLCSPLFLIHLLRSECLWSWLALGPGAPRGAAFEKESRALFPFLCARVVLVLFGEVFSLRFYFLGRDDFF